MASRASDWRPRASAPGVGADDAKTWVKANRHGVKYERR